MVIRRINATVLFVQDLAKCLGFYRDVIGLETIRIDDVSYVLKVEGQDFLLLHVTAAAEMVGEAAISPAGQPGGRVLFCAEVENADAAYAALMAKGLTFLKPPKDQPWGRRTAYFADPEGNLWELYQMLDDGQG